MKRVAVLLAILAISACLLGVSCGGRKQFDLATIERFEAAVDRAMATNKVPGMVVSVSSNDRETWTAAKGLADVAAGEVMKAEDAFRIASITKTFTATLALMLVDEGRIDLDAEAARYLPDLGIPGGVKVEQLLNHTSGIHEYTDTEQFLSQMSGNPSRVWKPEELVEIGLSQPVYFPPGQGFHYSNTNYVILGMIVEKSGGKVLGDLLEERILRPLKLEHTELPTERRMPFPYSNGYYDYNDDGNVDRFTDMLDPSMTWAAGAMISNAKDLRTWAAELARGDLLKEQTQELRLQTVKADLESLPGGTYGLGIIDYQGYWGHDGAIPGYNSAMFYRPSDGATVVVLGNSYNGAWTNAADQTLTGLLEALGE
ncbi:MAG: serine hydrolase domain-containing protein [Actinomycetota bacterium]